MDMETSEILKYLKAVADRVEWNGHDIEILLIGGAAGMLIGQLPAHRVTQDCDMMHVQPPHAQQAVLAAAVEVAGEKGLPQTWLDTQAMPLNVLPDGWRSRRVLVAHFQKLSVYAVGRRDLLAMKFFANRPQDRQDIIEMYPSHDEIDFARKYLNMLRVPSRQADLDQVVSALKLVEAMEKLFYGS
ncbi:MAG: DUF6036 family nucleotidyltransferase [Planctomycetales bacterium]|nr:DUF6036 family nucleotidyltransferase [Planctomycetales bacterium]